MFCPGLKSPYQFPSKQAEFAKPLFLFSRPCCLEPVPLTRALPAARLQRNGATRMTVASRAYQSSLTVPVRVLAEAPPQSPVSSRQPLSRLFPVDPVARRPWLAYELSLSADPGTPGICRPLRETSGADDNGGAIVTCRRRQLPSMRGFLRLLPERRPDDFRRASETEALRGPAAETGPDVKSSFVSPTDASSNKG